MKLPIWFLGGGVALMAAELNALPRDPETWPAQLAFDLLTSFFLIISSTAMTYVYAAHRHAEYAKA